MGVVAAGAAGSGNDDGASKDLNLDYSELNKVSTGKSCVIDRGFGVLGVDFL